MDVEEQKASMRAVGVGSQAQKGIIRGTVITQAQYHHEHVALKDLPVLGKLRRRRERRRQYILKRFYSIYSYHISYPSNRS